MLLGATREESCAALRRAVIPNLDIIAAGVADGACRVEAIARPRRNAAIRIELWLPASAAWSGRYYQMGNGGFAGSIDRATLAAAAAAHGDVAAATDTGHRGTGFDASWAASRPDLVEDYAGRSIKVTADAAAALTRLYYGRPAARRYFMGCSFGGRQALVAATRWPDDWDGVIAGAPAADWPRRLEAFATIQHSLRTVPGGWIPPERIADLAAIAHAACRQGQMRCAPEAVRRACDRGRKAACLAPAQNAALRVIDAAGYPLGDADPAEWQRWILNPDPAAPSQLTFATQAARFLLHRGPRWTIAAYHPRPIDPATRRTFALGSLGRFATKGGKVLSYFGTADAVLPPGLAVADARAHAAEVGGGQALMRTYRLFLIPGMAHCQGGAAPHAIGQSLPAPSLQDDPQHDVRRTLEAWVERGIVPNSLIAASLPDGSPRRTLVLRAVNFGAARTASR
jgi:feruloyl esterase